MARSSMTIASYRTRARLDRVNREYEADESFAHLRPWANFVPGCGAMQPRAILIGEAPGVNEDRERQPFIGASGKLLDELLHGIQVLRADCYVTNVVKYRPADNRTPTEEEVDDARPHLRNELGAFADDPNDGDYPPVVLLGRVALHMVDPEASISKARGMIISRGPWRFLPVYHPAAALRNGNLLNTMRGDFNTMRRLLTS